MKTSKSTLLIAAVALLALVLGTSPLVVYALIDDKLTLDDIVDAEGLSAPTLFPDGKSFVLTRAGQVALVPSSGGWPIVLTTTQGEKTRIRWSQDGSALTYASERAIWSVPVAGGKPLHLSDSSKGSGDPRTAVGQNAALSAEKIRAPVRVLLVVAHPDDEYEVAGTVYRITKELSGTVDQLIITNGEGGYRYSSLAERYYGVPLTNEAVGRARLPRIRKEEARQAGKVLGIRHQWFLDEKDEHFALSADEVLDKSWKRERVLRAIKERLRKGHYDFVFVLLPTEDTHGEHKAASILALQATEELPEERRPVVLGGRAGGDEEKLYKPLAEYPLTATSSPASQYQFDRNVRFGYRESLSYQIIVDWVIAEHKSQGLFQTRCQQDRFERFWIFNLNGDTAAGETASLFAAISLRPVSAGETGITGSAKVQ